MRIVTRRWQLVLLVLSLALASAACERAQLLAPTNSTITLSSSVRVLPTGGSAELSAFVSEGSGTPVQNGTTVRFTTTLGRIDPIEAQTRNGVATTTFFAGESSGVAEIKAISGGAGGGTGTTNTISITVGAAAVNTVTLRANPGSVGPSGGTVELIATVVAEGGRTLEAIPVTFRTSQGVLNPLTATTSASGEARTTLTTSQEATVTATAGTKDSNAVTIGVRAAPGVTLACAPSGGTAGSNCSAVQPTGASNVATVVFTVSRGTGTSNLRSATLNFGDGSSQDLGTLAGGAATITHSYSGPSGSSPATYVASVQATDVNGESTSTSVTVGVIPRQPLAISLTVSLATAVLGQGQTATLTSTVTPAAGGADAAKSYSWDFGDGSTATTSGPSTSHVYTTNGPKTATVTVETTDGRTATARAEFVTSGI
jgi:hypothetical protein